MKKTEKEEANLQKKDKNLEKTNEKNKEKIMEIVFLLAACVSILAVALICVFLFANGIPAMAKIGLPDFLFGMKWKPSNGLYGIFPFILGSIYVTAGAIVVGVPTALLLAIFLASKPFALKSQALRTISPIAAQRLFESTT